MSTDELEQRIRIRAYFHWLNNRGRPGHTPLEDWLKAEREEVESTARLLTASSAAAGGAHFHFQKLLIKLDCSSSDIFAEDGSIIHGSPQWPVLVHEALHYVQAISTVLGQRVLLNWFAVIVETARHLLHIDPLPVPMNELQAQRAAPGIIRAVRTLADYLAESNALIGTGHPLRPQAEAASHPNGTFYDYSFPHPRDQTPLTSVALCLTSSDGRAFGVPILGDALTEGMAKCAQWLAERRVYVDDDLGDCLPRPNIYYYAVLRCVRQRLPTWDPLLTTILLCDASLCSRVPGSTLSYLVGRLESVHAPRSLAGYKEVRRALDRTVALKEGREFILNEIDLAEAGLPSGEGSFWALFRRLLDVFRRAWELREHDGACTMDFHYGPDFLTGIVEKMGAPPIFFSDRTHYIALTSDLELQRICHAMSACFELLLGLSNDGLKAPCSLLHTKQCAYRKTSACRENLLLIPIDPVSGQACSIAFAAKAMELYGRRRLFVI
ncbi:DUF2934 domain-containing protein [Sorangium sp. So ce145]|uniref:DUF2934 domain-containing protein n=1 Tax=Sorangium sp. So ce145 TaxID=3133285 RepID=UPI003F602A0B